MKRKDFSNLKVEVQKEKNNYFEHEDYIAGSAPFLRGINSTGYLQTPWKTLNEIDNDSLTSEISIIEQNEVETESELAYLLLQAYNQIIVSLSKGNNIDSITSKISFKWKSGDNLPFEISKIRAARLLWAKMIQQFQPKNQQSLALKTHIDCNNEYLQSLASILGGAQSIASTNAISQLILEETYTSKTVDPFAGSTIIEQTTEELVFKNWKLFLEFIKTE